MSGKEKIIFKTQNLRGKPLLNVVVLKSSPTIKYFDLIN